MSAVSELEFLRTFQRLLDEGEFVATYKFALLQALADISVEYELADRQLLQIPLTAIAEKFIEYYWGQTLPYAPNLGDSGILKQNAGKQAAIVNWLVRERTELGGTLSKLRSQSGRWHQLLKNVASQIKTMPLWKLQVIGGQVEEFLYRQNHLENGCIELLPGVQQSFRSFHGLVTNLVRGGWLAQIRRIQSNTPLLGERGDIVEFLFGSERRGLQGYRSVLREHQAANCFYCGREVKHGGEADHFIPWVRYPVDLGHNFVFAHAQCNNSKRDLLAAPEYLNKWREQNLELGVELSEQFDQQGLMHDLERSRQITWWAYEQGQRSNAHVWAGRNQISRLNESWRMAFSDLPRVAEKERIYMADSDST